MFLQCTTCVMCGVFVIGLDVLENHDDADKPERKRARMESSNQDVTLKVRLALELQYLLLRLLCTQASA